MAAFKKGKAGMIELVGCYSRLFDRWDLDWAMYI